MDANKINNVYGNNIKQLRIERKMGQEQLAEKADLSSGFISEIENFKKSGTLETLAKIANALEVEPYELLLPKNQTVNYDSRKTKQLMKQLRTNLSAVMDTMEKFLEDK